MSQCRNEMEIVQTVMTATIYTMVIQHYTANFVRTKKLHLILNFKQRETYMLLYPRNEAMEQNYRSGPTGTTTNTVSGASGGDPSKGRRAAQDSPSHWRVNLS